MGEHTKQGHQAIPQSEPLHSTRTDMGNNPYSTSNIHRPNENHFTSAGDHIDIPRLNQPTYSTPHKGVHISHDTNQTHAICKCQTTSVWWHSWVELKWLFNVTINDISVIYVTAHRCAGGLKKKLDLRSGSQRHRHFVGFFNVPVLAPTRDHPFYTVIPTHRPI